MIDTEALRKKVIDLAIQGEFTEQLPEDGDARDLYAQIQEEKAKLIKEGKIKKQKDFPPIEEDEIPFKIPKNWMWVHMGEVFEHNTGKALNNSKKEGEELEYITTSNLYWDRFELDSLKRMFFKESEIEKCTIKKGDLLICEGGDIGRAAIWNFDYDMRIQNHVHKLRGYCNINHRYYFYIMRNYKDNGMIDGRGIGLQGFSSKRVHGLLVPLPPLFEQIRIVDKLDAILKQIDIIDELQQQYASSIEVLKSKVIDAGIRGKLTEQLPEDGNAEDLYNQIQEEKKKLIKEGKIKKQKPLPPIEEDEIPFDIPKNWKWVRLGEACLQISDGTHKTPHYQKEGVPFLSVKDITSGHIDFSDVKYISETEHNDLVKRCKPQKNDILICRIGTLGKALVIDVDERFSIFVSLGLIKTGYKELSDYICAVVNSGYGSEWIKKHKAGGAMHASKINLNDLREMMLPLPPSEEQKRISQRIEEMMNLLA